MLELELAATLVTALCVFLAGRNNIHTWWVGIVGCTMFGVLFFMVEYYAQAALQVFFIFTGIVGWRTWHHNKSEHELPIRAFPVTHFCTASMGAVIAAAASAYILYSFTNSDAPMADSAIAAFSVLGQLLLMYRFKETWIVWIFVNTMAIPLFISSELYYTAGLYVVFWIHAFVAWFYWQKLFVRQHLCQGQQD